MKTLQPLFFFVSLLLVVGLACSFGGGSEGNPTAPPQPTAVQVIEPTTAPTEVPPEPTEAPPTSAPQPTEPSVSDFYTEQFDVNYDPNNWVYYVLGTGEDTDLVIEQEDDHLLFDLGDEDLYIYYMYTPYTYSDVSLTLNAENRGRNNNNISLVCRFDPDASEWYEFSVESGGVWVLYAYQDGYHALANGGTNALKQGREVNEYSLTCNGDEITMFVNGDRLSSFEDGVYNFNEGQVGFNISSLNVLPITVAVDWFEISQP